jgi:hypothetical protein
MQDVLLEQEGLMRWIVVVTGWRKGTQADGEGWACFCAGKGVFASSN